MIYYSVWLNAIPSEDEQPAKLIINSVDSQITNQDLWVYRFSVRLAIILQKNTRINNIFKHSCSYVIIRIEFYLKINNAQYLYTWLRTLKLLTNIIIYHLTFSYNFHYNIKFTTKKKILKCTIQILLLLNWVFSLKKNSI